MPSVKLDEIVEADADVGTVGVGLGIDERRRIVAAELEATVAGELRQRYQALAFRLLQLQPGAGAHAQRQIGRIQAAVGVVLFVDVGGHAELDVIAEPVVRLAASRQRIDVVETRRVLVTHDQVGLVAG